MLPSYEELLADGQAYQDFVEPYLAAAGIPFHAYRTVKEQYEIGESPEGVEVKLDRRCLETKQLSIEIGEKTKKTNYRWVKSGILRKDNTIIYVQGTYDIIFPMDKNALVDWYEYQRPRWFEAHGTVRKFYIDLIDVEQFCADPIFVTEWGIKQYNEATFRHR